MKLIYDREGHGWILGEHFCTVCGMPLHESQANYGTHPTCGGDD